MQGRHYAFTLLEVLLSVLLLFTMGLALLKFDGWIKDEVSRYKEKAILLYTATPLLYTDILTIQQRNLTMYDATSFSKLRDDEIFWLKDIKAHIRIGKEEKKTLFQSGDLDLKYTLYPLQLKNSQAAIGFIGIAP